MVPCPRSSSYFFFITAPKVIQQLYPRFRVSALLGALDFVSGRGRKGGTKGRFVSGSLMSNSACMLCDGLCDEHLKATHTHASGERKEAWAPIRQPYRGHDSWVWIKRVVGVPAPSRLATLQRLARPPQRSSGDGSFSITHPL